MLFFVQYHLASLFIGVLLVGAVVGVIIWLLRRKKRGISNCSCSCSGCQYSDACAKKHQK
ncbi:FeoB-associated Cys-rich membrane protein [Oscillospiraceae bacterium CM]|nr:FeoB-associated Cys-rich membrane protein [Oscillospiraceae bacterium CM]